MNTLLRWYNKNRKVFWISIATIIGIIILIQILNNYYKNHKKNDKNDFSIYTNPNYSVISEEKIDNEVADNNKNLIDSFIENCNSKNFDAAYEIISDDCKSKIFPSIDTFIEYINKVFPSKRIYSYQAWVISNGRYTYRVELSEDILATGNSNPKKTECYYTIVHENGEDKLNIKNYVGSEQLNKSGQANGVKITAVKKDIYMDYEIYTFIVEKEKSRTVQLDSGEYLGSMYLQNLNGGKTFAEQSEINKEDLTIAPYKSDEIEITYANPYSSENSIKKIVFNDIILDYTTYNSMQNKLEYTKRGTVEIEL